MTALCCLRYWKIRGAVPGYRTALKANIPEHTNYGSDEKMRTVEIDENS